MRMTRMWKLPALAGVLVLCLAGGATAASKITGQAIKDNSITTKDIRNRSLMAKDFKSGQLPRGPRGVTGARGPQGPAGPAGPVNVGGIVRVERTATVLPGDVDSVTAGCPAGYGFVSGGFQSISADGEVFFADTFGSRTTYSVGLDNFDSTLEGDITAVAFCAPSGRAIVATSASVRDRIARLVRARRASHR
jgi:hypothetical protein